MAQTPVVSADQVHQGASPAAREDEVTFTEAEYSENVAKVIAHAETTGRAVVVGPDGKPRIIITIPIADLPTLEY